MSSHRGWNTGSPSKPIRCPGYLLPDGTEVVCQTVTAVPTVRGGLEMTADAAGYPAQGFRCRVHVRVPGRREWRPEPAPYLPERPLPSEELQQLARHQRELSVQRAERLRRQSAAVALRMWGVEVLNRPDISAADRAILRELIAAQDSSRFERFLPEGVAWRDVA